MEMISLQVQILFFLLAGYGFGKKGMISQTSAGQLNSLVMNLILPANIFKAFLSSPNAEVIRSSFSIFLLACAICLIMVIVSRVLWKPVQSEAHRLSLEYATMSNNAGALGVIIAQAAFGDAGVLLASLFAVPVRILMWSYGLALYSKKEASSTLDLLKKIASNPCMIASVLGCVMIVLSPYGFALPKIAVDIISALAACNTVLLMIVIGVTLSAVPLRSLADRTIGIYCMIRLVIIPAVFLLVLRLLPVSALSAGVCVIELGMPAPLTMSLLANRYHCDEQYASALIFLSTALSMISLPLWTFILKLL